MSVSQVTDEVLYTGLIEMQELPELYSSQSDTLQEVNSPILVNQFDLCYLLGST